MKINEIRDKLFSLYEDRGFELSNTSKQNFKAIAGHAGIGGSINEADLNIFCDIADFCRKDIKTIYIIGNAFGYSTLALTLLFPDAQIDVIEAEVYGNSGLGTEITRNILSDIGASDRVQITIGFSPQDVPSSCRFDKYDLVFIDGDHTNRQQSLDHKAVSPYLKESSILLLHDVIWSSMQKSFNEIASKYNSSGLFSGSKSGMGIVSNNYEDEINSLLDKWK